MPFLKAVTGEGLTTLVNTPLTDLGIMRWDSDRNAIAAVFGDSFGNGGWGTDWRSPVILMFDADFNCIGTPVRGGIATQPAKQCWEYGHNNPDFSTALPCDIIRIGTTWYMFVMLTQGLGNERMTEAWQSQNLVDWTLSGFGFPHPASDPCTTMLSFDQFGDDVYIVGTHGLRRDGNIKMWKTLASTFPKGYWEPCGIIRDGRHGELCLRNVQGNAVLSFFDELNYRQTALTVAHPDDDWAQANQVDYVSGQELPQLYGGYISPTSKLDEPDGMKFFVSQWVTATNFPYHVVAYSGTLSAKGPITDIEQPTVAVNAKVVPVADPVDVLSEAMGGSLSRDRYAALLPAVSACLRDCDCTTVPRIAMWMAQIGHESGGLQWMQEIADGTAYEGRADLGNTERGDGHRFRGHGPIQVTGRRNHQVLSEWAYSKGMVPTATYFVDNPDELASDDKGFMGVTWYWVTQRKMNEASDARDITTATRYVNGGDHGLDDRTARYNRAMGMGDRLLTLVCGAVTAPATAPVEKVLAYNHAQQSVAQEKFFDCCPASTQIVLDGLDIHMSEDELIRAIGTDTNGTNTVEQALPILNQKAGAGGKWLAQWMPNDPPRPDQVEALWHNVKTSIDAGHGCVLNFEVPSSNFPRGTRGSASPQYRGAKVWHYVSCMGYADDGPGGRHLWISDPGFGPFTDGGYFMSLQQAATAIPPHAYAYFAPDAVAPTTQPPVPQPVPVAVQAVASTPAPVGDCSEFWAEWASIELGDVDSIVHVIRTAASAGTPEVVHRAKTVLSKVSRPALTQALGLVEPDVLKALMGRPA